MKEGDQQQGNEVLVVLPNVFIHATVGGCVWHIVDRSWHKYIGHAHNVIMKKDYVKWDSIRKLIHGYIYAWMIQTLELSLTQLG